MKVTQIYTGLDKQSHFRDLTVPAAGFEPALSGT